MKVYKGENWKLYNGNMLDMCEVIEPNSIDSIVTDPPYELNFMNKGWDNSGIAFDSETWKRCYEALKSGGYLLAFGGSRTYHRIACAIEDAGFEIRDTIMWLYGSGFPKSMNIGLAIDKKNGVEGKVIGTRNSCDMRGGAYNSSVDKHGGARIIQEVREATNKWRGWGTALKPSYEPIIIARKPCEGSCTDNVLKYGVGGINIDECRVAHDEKPKFTNRQPKSGSVFNTESSGYDNTKNHSASADVNGRFPANTILTYGETDFDEVCGGMPQNTKSTGGKGEKSMNYGQYSGGYKEGYACDTLGGYGDSGSAARYFYCAKASKRDRDEGLSIFESQKVNDGRKKDIDNAFQRGVTLRKNTHPTVKPTSLMQYLVRLVTPKGGIVLDPFNGSGSTGKAVMYENKDRDAGYKYIGIEITEEYIPIAIARIKYASSNTEEDEQQEKYKQMDIYDFIERTTT